MALRLSNTTRNAMVNAVVGGAGLEGATLSVYDGTQPGTAGASTSGCTLLVQIASLSWSGASNGTAGLSASSGTAGTASTTGTASWARLSTGTASTALTIDGGCGTAATNSFVIDTKVITAEAVVVLTTADIVQPSE